jgi:hypothetical protein
MKQHLAALQYEQFHWSVIPMRAYDKRPVVNWQQYQHHRASQTQINQWFRRWPTANVGIVTGEVSGIVVLDIDPGHGGDKSVAMWEEQYGPLPATLEVTTGGGGRHLYFQHPGGVIHNKAGIAPGIDLRADGGCVVAPPSIHASGKHYTWVPGHGPGYMKPAPMPAWLLKLVNGSGKIAAHSVDHWRQLVRQGVQEGERNNTIASLTGHLLWHGVDPQVVLELLLCWNQVRCKPALSDEEVISAVNSITRLHEREVND